MINNIQLQLFYYQQYSIIYYYFLLYKVYKVFYDRKFFDKQISIESYYKYTQYIKYNKIDLSINIIQTLIEYIVTLYMVLYLFAQKF